MRSLGLSSVSGGLAPLILYSDKLTASESFSTRQWFASGASNSITYGSGEVRILSGATGRHCLCHFDCMKDQYPVFASANTYSIGDIVYGGAFGHGLYSKTALASGAPIFSSATNSQDANGWTRYRPASRNIEEGKSLNISFNLKMDRTGFTVGASNSIRIGLFRSVGAFVNYDNSGQGNSVFSGYSGYFLGCGSSSNKLYKRTALSSQTLINSITAIYTELATQGTNGFGSQDIYDVSLSLKRVGASLQIESAVSGEGYSCITSYTDNSSPYLSFDTIVFQAISNSVASVAVSNPIAVYTGVTQSL